MYTLIAVLMRVVVGVLGVFDPPPANWRDPWRTDDLYLVDTYHSISITHHDTEQPDEYPRLCLQVDSWSACNFKEQP